MYLIPFLILALASISITANQNDYNQYSHSSQHHSHYEDDYYGSGKDYDDGYGSGKDYDHEEYDYYGNDDVDYYVSGKDYDDNYGSGNENDDDYGSGNENDDDYGSGNENDDYGSEKDYDDNYGSGNENDDDYGSGNEDYGSGNENDDDYGSGKDYDDGYGSGKDYDVHQPEDEDESYGDYGTSEHGDRDDCNNNGEQDAPICSSEPWSSNLVGGSCYRYVKGYDVTGVTNEVDLAFPEIDSVCDCIRQCLINNQTCASWVWKFTTPSEHRSCTLYSNFNLPPGVVIDVNVENSTNVPPLQAANNPQMGGQVPACTIDGTATGKADDECHSGALWFLSNGKFAC